MIKNLYSYLQKKVIRFRTFGKNSIVKFPYKIWGRKFIELGSNVFIAENAFLSAVERWEGQAFTPNLKIGNNVTIGSNFFVTCIKSVTIEDNVLISDRVFIADHVHGYENPKLPVLRQPLEFKGEVLIKEGSFIGINVVIMPGVTVGKNSVVGASAVVTKNVPDNSVVAGNPARIIKHFDSRKKAWVK
jgi:acetyltransferase-like isoleucine patch superfamily enzyme